jgi:aminopeptidase-like protein
MTLLLQDLDPAAAARDAFGLMRALLPLPRSLTGNGVRRSLDLIHALAPLERSEVASGTPIYDWDVPDEWNIREAYIADAQGQRIVDFRASTLHVVGCSTPVRARMTRAELEPHLHSLPEHPEWIPQRSSCWRRDWGFCLAHAVRERLGEGPFDVVIDSTLEPGHLSYGECVVPGRGHERDGGDALIYTHTCHAALANDNLTGMAAAAVLARALRDGGVTPRLTWRFVFGPATIGSLVWLSRNEPLLPRLRAGLVIGLLGDRAALTYKRSRRGDTVADRAAALEMSAAGGRVVDFEPFGYDERQFCSPGFDLPVGRLTRSQHGEYPEYHTSADNLALIDESSLAQSIAALARVIATIDANRSLRNTMPKGEPRLGKRGLYAPPGPHGPGEREKALLWLLNLCDGTRDLIDVAQTSGMPFDALHAAALALEQTGLLEDITQPNPTASR